MKISKRLKEIASYANSFNSLVDVGADHGLLGIYAYKELGIKKVLLTDINPEPLNQANENLKIYHLDKDILVKLGNGLEPINDQYDCLVIAGMGGMLIKDIISNDINKAKSFKRLILAPNRDSFDVRKYLTSNGFKIVDEVIIQDYKFYEIIIFEPTDDCINYQELELKYGPIILKNKTPEFYKYYSNQLQKLKESLIKSKENKDLSLKIKELTEILK